MEVKQVEIKKLKEYENNPRNNEKAVEKVAASIKEFGFKVPIIVDRNNVIVAGHTRLKAAHKLGLECVPVIVASDLTPEQIKAFRLADNKVAEYATWDFEKLEKELDALSMDMTEFGFENLEQEEQIEVVEDEFTSELQEESNAKRGDIYQLGNHRLMCGDSTSVTDLDKLLDGKKVDMVFTDPPYGMKKEKDGVANDNLNYDDLLEFNRQWISLTFNALKDRGGMVLLGD